MRQAVTIAEARTPIGRVYRGRGATGLFEVA